MADPVTLAMVGAAAGAVTNKKDPLKGALMGAALGGGGGLLAGGAAAGGAAAGGSGLLGGAAPLGATAAGGLTASAIPAGGVVGGGALLAGGAPAAAAPGLMSQLANPAVLAAGSQLAGSMTPKQAQTAPGRVSPGQQVPIEFQPPPIAMTPIGRFANIMPLDEELGLFDTPSMIRTQMRPGQNDLMLNYIPSRGR
jgi:hypothetical protein